MARAKSAFKKGLPVPAFSLLTLPPPDAAVWTIDALGNATGIPEILGKAEKHETAKGKPVVLAVKLDNHGSMAYLLPPDKTPKLGLELPGKKKEEPTKISDLPNPQLLRSNIIRLITKGGPLPTEKDPHIEPVIGDKIDPITLKPEVLFRVARPSWVEKSLIDFRFVSPDGALAEPEPQPTGPDTPPDNGKNGTPDLKDVSIPDGFGVPRIDIEYYKNLTLVIAAQEYTNIPPISHIPPENARNIWNTVQSTLTERMVGEITGKMVSNTKIHAMKKAFTEAGESQFPDIYLLTQANSPRGYLIPFEAIESFFDPGTLPEIASYDRFRTMHSYGRKNPHFTIFRFKAHTDEDEGVLVAFLPLPWLARLKATMEPALAPGATANTPNTPDGGP